MVVQRPKLLELLEEHINISELIPVNWFFHYNKDIGRPHNNSLESIVSSLLLQKMLSIPTIDLLITFLSFSKELRDFCGLKSIPDASFYSKFKQLYCNDIEAFFISLLILLSLFAKKLVIPLKMNSVLILLNYISLIPLVSNALLKKITLNSLMLSSKSFNPLTKINLKSISIKWPIIICLNLFC